MKNIPTSYIKHLSPMNEVYAVLEVTSTKDDPEYPRIHILMDGYFPESTHQFLVQGSPRIIYSKYGDEGWAKRNETIRRLFRRSRGNWPRIWGWVLRLWGKDRKGIFKAGTEEAELEPINCTEIPLLLFQG